MYRITGRAGRALAFLALLLTVGLLPGGAQAAGGDAALLREARDRVQIEDLMWRYCRALDSQQADAYAAVYTEDGQFGSGSRAAKGRDALRKMIDDIRKGRQEREAKGEKSPPMHHMILNHSIVFHDADHATYHAYWMTVFGAVGAEQPVRVAAAGRSVDELVRVKGQWLIRTRDVAPRE